MTNKHTMNTFEAMITEDYISFETAKLLKEKGFDGQCHMSIGKNEQGEMLVKGTDWDDSFILCPTLQMAMKWLREVHNIIPVILIGGYNKVPFYYWFRIDKINDGEWEDSVYRNEVERNTYEEACEAAIKYCLENLI